MAAKHYILALAATRRRLSDVYANPVVGGPDDVPYRQILIQTETADAFIGGPTVTTTDYGFWISPVAAATNSVMPIGPFETGPVKLSDLWGIGAGAILHIEVIPY